MVGHVSTNTYSRRLEERERTTLHPGYIDGRYCPAGTVVKEGAVDGYSKLIGAGSIYAITPCSQEAALKAVEDMQHRPLMTLQLPPDRALPAEIASVECPTCHSVAIPCECESADDDEDDEDEEDDHDERPDLPNAEIQLDKARQALNDALDKLTGRPRTTS